MLTNAALFLGTSAVLAIHATTAADIQRRELSAEVPTKIELLSGRSIPCAVRAWSGESVDGACGTTRWEDIKPGGVVAILRACVPAKDAAASADAVAVVLSLPAAEAAGRTITDWARRSGATDEQLTAARKEAEVLRAARLEREQKAVRAKLSTLTPEAGSFPKTPWTVLSDAAFEQASAEMLEAARAVLSRAGTSGTMHETKHVALLAESGDEAFRSDAASLEQFVGRWAQMFTDVGATLALQGRIPVVVVGDRDRWRLIVASAGCDASMYPDVLVTYPVAPAGAPPRALVLVAPNSDRARQRYFASVGVARAMLHSTSSTERGPAWLNEGLPRVMAEVATPTASMDELLRKPALVALRAGGGFSSLFHATYADPMWTGDVGIAQSMSYIFVRWLYEQSPSRLFRFAKGTMSSSDTVEVRFQKAFAVSLAAAADNAVRWFQTND